MIWISEVFPTSTRDDLPPYKPEFAKRAEKVKVGFHYILDEEMEKIDEAKRVQGRVQERPTTQGKDEL